MLPTVVLCFLLFISINGYWIPQGSRTDDIENSIKSEAIKNEEIFNGNCPEVKLNRITCLNEISDKQTCFDTSECGEDENCCFDGCNLSCIKVKQMQPRVCPIVHNASNERCPPIKQSDVCVSDSSCKPDEKCCSDGCHSFCVKSLEMKSDGEEEKTAASIKLLPATTATAKTVNKKISFSSKISYTEISSCPVMNYKENAECVPPGADERSCLFDDDCNRKELCCSNGCRLMCTKRNEKQDTGADKILVKEPAPAKHVLDEEPTPKQQLYLEERAPEDILFMKELAPKNKHEEPAPPKEDLLVDEPAPKEEEHLPKEPAPSDYHFIEKKVDHEEPAPKNKHKVVEEPAPPESKEFFEELTLGEIPLFEEPAPPTEEYS